MRSIGANIRRVYAYRFLSECFLIIPILVPLYRASGLSGTEVLVVQAIFTVAVFVFEVPSGYFSDVLGRRPTLILGGAFHMLGLLAYALASSFWGFAAAELVLAFGLAMRSGTDTAILYDSLQALGRTEAFTESQGRAELATRIGAALGAVLGGALGAVAVLLPLWINVASGAAMTLLALGLAEPPRERHPFENPWHGIGRIVVRCVRDRRLRLQMALSAVLVSSGITALWVYLLYFQAAGVTPALTGIVFSVFQLASGFGSQLAARIEARLGARATWAVVGLMPVFFLASSAVPVVAVCAAAMIGYAFVWGVSGPLIMTRINETIPSDVRATVLSVNGMGVRVAYAGLGPGIGQLVDRVSVRAGLAALGAWAGIGLAAVGAAAWAGVRRRARPAVPTARAS